MTCPSSLEGGAVLAYGSWYDPTTAPAGVPRFGKQKTFIAGDGVPVDSFAVQDYRPDGRSLFDENFGGTLHGVSGLAILRDGWRNGKDPSK